MSQSAHTTAPVTLTTEVDATALVELRQLLRAEAGEQSDALSYDLLMAIIVAHALRKHPELNASLTQDGIVQRPQVNIGMALGTERGLLVPDADLRAKVARALEGRATPQDRSAGTFTITNLGLYDVDAFTPLINLRECAVLGMGRIRAQPVMREGELVIGQTMALSLTFDHLLVDRAPAARFLQEVARLVKNPMLLLLR